VAAAPGEAADGPARAPVAGNHAAPRAVPGLYVHVPFCAHVCPYCDFAVQTGGPHKRAAYVDALLREIRWRADEASTTGGEGDAGERAKAFRAGFGTVYLGGGTPSALSVDALRAVLATIRAQLGVHAGAEVTLEANPEDVDEASAACWRELGITRLSLGVQSFDDEALRALGRSHDARRAERAVQDARGAGFDAVSLDLIFAVPGQSAAGWEATLQRAIALQPDHVSCYELTVHEGTRFFRQRARGRLVEQPDETKEKQFFATHESLAAAGYGAYEVSNFARHPAHRSRHNAGYWDHSPYLGVGPAAHSFDGERRRWWNERRLVDWKLALDQGGGPAFAQETLAPADLALEALALGFRTTAGVDLGSVARRTGLDLAPANADVIDGMVRDDLLRVAGSRLVPTLAGLAIADTLARQFEIPSPAPGDSVRNGATPALAGTADGKGPS
jgi:oxygen-independent coproporphyrinogen-3 oxidase